MANPTDIDVWLIAAIKENNSQTVQSLLERGANPNACDRFLFRGYQPYRSPALHIALRCCDERGTGIAVPEQEQTPLMLAAASNHTTVVHELLERGAACDRQDRFGLSALMYAANRPHLDCLRLLLDWGASVHLRLSRVNGMAI